MQAKSSERIFLLLLIGVIQINIQIHNSSSRSIYEQIYESIKREIISGALPADEPLPSIRNLAKDLKISVITTKRAYDELERDKFIYTIPGKGTFAAKQNTSMIREQYIKEIEEHLQQIIQICSLSGITPAEVRDIYDALCSVGDDNT